MNLDNSNTPLIIKDRLPERMAQRIKKHGVGTNPSIIRSTLLYHYKEAYDAIAPILEKEDIPGVIPPFDSLRQSSEFSDKAVQNFYNGNFSYQLYHNKDAAYSQMVDNPTQLQRNATQKLSGLIAVSLKLNPEKISKLLENGLDAQAKIDCIQPSSSDYNKTVIEYCTKKGGIENVLPFVKHDKNFSDIDLLNKTNTMFDVLKWAHENNRPKLEKKIQNYIVEKDITISPTQATKISPESAYAILKAGVKNNNASKNLDILYSKIEQNDNVLNKLAY